MKEIKNTPRAAGVLLVPVRLPEEEDAVSAFLRADVWPFHANAVLTPEKAIDLVQAMSAKGVESFWLERHGNRLGIIRAFDLDDVDDDGYPMLDVRIASRFRRQGIGSAGVAALVEHLFARYPSLRRVGASTRQDNVAMRAVLSKCGFAKEGHFRADWRCSDGRVFDTVHYGLLRNDWQSGHVTPVDWEDDEQLPRQRVR